MTLAWTSAHWPLVGRADERTALTKARLSETTRGVVISGPPGVGKSRLATAALEEADGDGWATVLVRASDGLAALPLSSLRAVIDVAGRPTDQSELAAGIERRLRELADGRPLLLMVDDAHLFDDASAGLVHAFAASGDAFVVATVRDDAPRPRALTALWKDGLAERLELGTLSRSDTAELVRAVLVGDVEDATVERLWQVTAGNALYLREVILASHESGALREVDGRWQWRGRWTADARLREVVADRLGELDPDELATIEALALGGPLGYEVVVQLTGPDAVTRLEAKGLLQVERSGRRTDISVAHPLHAKVVSDGLPALQARAIRRNLADALTRLGARRESDRISLACWSLQDGHEVDPVTLRLAADAALWHVGHAIADRLAEILPEAPAPRAGSVSLTAPSAALAVQLARAAWEAAGTVSAGAGLATTLAWTGATDEADAVLTQVQATAPPGDDRLRIALARSRLRFWGQHRPDEAVDVLDQADRASSPTDDPSLREELLVDKAGILLNVGRADEAHRMCELAAERRGVPLEASPAAPTAAAALAMAGHCRAALDLVDRALPVASGPGWSEMAVPQLLLARVGALARAGELEESYQLAETCREVALASDSLDGAAIYGVSAGEVLLRQGRPASAARRFRDATGLLGERDPLGYLSWAHGGLARARAMLGDERGASQSLADAIASSTMPRYFDSGLGLAKAAVAALGGREAEAFDACLAAADRAGDDGLTVDEAIALDAAMRLRAERGLADRLTALVERAESPLVAALARCADAAVERDHELWLATAEELAELPAWLYAAESAAAAALELRRRDRPRDAQAAVRLAGDLARHCEGARSPLLDRIAAPSALTRRELEVARLAALGHPSKVIADRLALSVRTVDSHLYRTYTKLGVSDRAALARALVREGGEDD